LQPIFYRGAGEVLVYRFSMETGQPRNLILHPDSCGSLGESHCHPTRAHFAGRREPRLTMLGSWTV
jgi:hypothetical protein